MPHHSTMRWLGDHSVHVLGLLCLFAWMCGIQLQQHSIWWPTGIERFNRAIQSWFDVHFWYSHELGAIQQLVNWCSHVDMGRILQSFNIMLPSGMDIIRQILS